MSFQERYKPVPIGVNATIPITADQPGMCGFACITSGTLTVVNNYGTTIINAIPVTAGTYLPLPFALETGQKGSVTTAGGASGTIGF